MQVRVPLDQHCQTFVRDLFARLQIDAGEVGAGLREVLQCFVRDVAATRKDDGGAVGLSGKSIQK